MSNSEVSRTDKWPTEAILVCEWVIATLAGLAVYGLLLWALSGMVFFGWGAGLAVWWGMPFWSHFLGATIVHGIQGAIIGLIQWIVLRRRLANTGRWVLATAGGWAFAGGFGWLLLGPLLGLFQWRVLRRRITHSGWWILGSTVAWIFAFIAGESASNLASDLGSSMHEIAYAAGVALGGGFLTGMTLALLMPRSKAPATGV